MPGTLTAQTAFLGRVSYRDAWELQKTLLEEVAGRRDGGWILFLEHDPVITLGRTGSWDNLKPSRAEVLKAGVELVECDRGGDITAHYPGQLVTYPILPLDRLKRNVHWFLRMLEEAGIRTAARLGVQAGRKEGLTGVWVADAKLMAVGVGFRKWVSCHGVAFNVTRDEGVFDMIVPCGIKDKGVTSVEEITGIAPPVVEIAALMREALEEVFGMETQEAPVEEVWAAHSLRG